MIKAILSHLIYYFTPLIEDVLHPLHEFSIKEEKSLFQETESPLLDDDALALWLVLANYLSFILTKDRDGWDGIFN